MAERARDDEMTGNQILLDARTCFALGNIEYRRKFENEHEAFKAHKKSYRAAIVRRYKIIRRRGEKGYRFTHSGNILSIYYTGEKEQ